MPEATDQSDAKFEDANVRLNDGLVTCRSVVNDYRALILGVGSTTEDSAKQVEARAGIEPACEDLQSSA